jgi:hypothetical protein
MAKRKYNLTTRGYIALTFAMCTTVMTVVLTVTSGLGSSRDYMVLGVVWFEFCLAFVEPYDV